MGRGRACPRRALRSVAAHHHHTGRAGTQSSGPGRPSGTEAPDRGGGDGWAPLTRLPPNLPTAGGWTRACGGPEGGAAAPSQGATRGQATRPPAGEEAPRGWPGPRRKSPLPGPEQLPGPRGATHNPVLSLLSLPQPLAGRAPDLEGGWWGPGAARFWTEGRAQAPPGEAAPRAPAARQPASGPPLPRGPPGHPTQDGGPG